MQKYAEVKHIGGRSYHPISFLPLPELEKTIEISDHLPRWRCPVHLRKNSDTSPNVAALLLLIIYARSFFGRVVPNYNIWAGVLLLLSGCFQVAARVAARGWIVKLRI